MTKSGTREIVYLYNKKELQEELGLYDYGARFYDPLLGRWLVVDAKAEDPTQIDLSPYAYVGNNPVDKTDPDGNCPDCPVPTEQDLTGNDQPILVNAYYNAVDNVASGLATLYSGVKSLFGGGPMQEAKADYSNGNGGKLTYTTLNTAGDKFGATISAMFGVTSAIPIDGPAAGLFSKTTGVNSSAATVVKDIRSEIKASEIISSSGHKVDIKTGQKIGPSGKPMVHNIEHSSLKEAKDAARQGGSGTPVKHTKDLKGGAHYHPGSGVIGKGKGTKNYGSGAGKISNNVHHGYPD